MTEAEQLGSGSVLFLREQPQEEPVSETSCLKPVKREGLTLRSQDSEYPDLHIEGDSYLIGKRSASVDGCIPASTVSRIHARITRVENSYLLEDLNSTNGTQVDGRQLAPYELFPLMDGMRVSFASAEYVAEA